MSPTNPPQDAVRDSDNRATRTCAITRSPWISDDELFPWLLRKAPDDACIVRGHPWVERFFDGYTVHTKLPTMEAALWQYDPFLRPLAHGWKRKTWRHIALDATEDIVLEPTA